MKKRFSLRYSFLILALLTLAGCREALEEDVFTQFAPDDLKSEEGIFAVLSSAYGYTDDADRQRINAGEWPTDLAYQTGGFENGRAILFLNFSWDASVDILHGFYTRPYAAIRDANAVLESLPGAEISEAKKQLFEAEAKFLRALNYVRLYDLFGPVPLRRSTRDTLTMRRAGAEELQVFIEEELLAAIGHLPLPGEEAAYGRATSGSARGILCKFYLNTKQWDKAAEMAQEIIDMGYYSLFPSFEDMLKVENEGNREMIWINAASPLSARILSNTYISAAFPPGFRSWPEKGLVFQNNWRNPQTQYRLRDDFYHSFEPDDKRRDIILRKYVNNQGDTVDLLTTPDNTRSFRYWPDPEAQGEQHGNDLPEVRYADILLARAEALNELLGPNQESVDLINDVRARAGLAALNMAAFPSKEVLREHILKERAWEFYTEGLRRQDLIRMGKFVEYAQDRGVANAREYHILYPIPQAAMDSNPLLEQNEGY